MALQDTTKFSTYVEKRGYLIKKGGSVETWKRRLFVLEGNKLYYYAHVKHEKEKNTKGEVTLTGNCQVGLMAAEKISKGNCMWLSVPEIPRIYYAYADSFDEIDAWIKAVHHNIKHLEQTTQSSTMIKYDAIKSSPITSSTSTPIPTSPSTTVTRTSNSPSLNNTPPHSPSPKPPRHHTTVDGSNNNSDDEEFNGDGGGSTYATSHHAHSHSYSYHPSTPSNTHQPFKYSTSSSAFFPRPTMRTSSSAQSILAGNLRKNQPAILRDKLEYSFAPAPTFSPISQQTQSSSPPRSLLKEAITMRTQSPSFIASSSISSSLRNNKSFRNKGIMSPRAYASLFTHGGAIYLYGGECNGVCFGDLWKFSTGDETWEVCSQKGTIPTPRMCVASAYHKDFFYLFGGKDASKRNIVDDFYQLDLASFTWTKKISETSPRARANAQLAACNDKLYLSGGEGTLGSSSFLPNLCDLFEFNIGTNEWKQLTSPGGLEMHGSMNHSMAVDPEGVLYFYGGLRFRNALVLSSFYSYDTEKATWERLPSGPPLFGHSCCIKSVQYEGRTSLCAIFSGSPGITNPESSTLEVFSFDLEQRYWRQINLPDEYPPVLYHAATVLEDKMYLYGGVDAEEGVYNDFFAECVL